MKRDTSILHVIDTLGIGGAENLLVNTIHNLPEFKHILVYLRPPEDYLNDLKDAAIFYKLPFTGISSIPKCMWALRKIIKSHRIDLVHAHLLLPVLLARISCPSDVPFFFTIHSELSSDAFNKNYLSLFLERLTYNKNQHIIAVSKTVLTDYSNYVSLKGPSTVLYNFVSDIFFEQSKVWSNSDPLKIVSVGNLKPQKNYSLLLLFLTKINIKYQLDIFGTGELEEELAKIIERMQLNVTLKGKSNTIQTLLPHYDLFIAASSSEGFGIALVEAMACGIPVLMSDIPVFREVAGDCGFYFSLTKPEDFVKKLAHIQRLKQEGKLAAWGEKARSRAKEIATKKIYIEKLKNVYIHRSI